MKNLPLSRPLAIFDLESTGTDPESDRIVEISVLRIDPDGSREARTRRINPQRPIPPAATAVHGIGDENVRDEPTFRQIAKGLLAFLGDADLAGFNVLRFDMPLLDREFRDCGLSLELERRHVVDVMTIFHRMEPRNLSAAVRFYLDREHRGAHTAEADVAATAEVLEAQLERYSDLPRAVQELSLWCSPAPPPNSVDRAGKFVWQDGQVVFAFGKHLGRPLSEVAQQERDYLEWIVGTDDFPGDAREVVLAAMRGELPRPPEG